MLLLAGCHQSVAVKDVARYDIQVCVDEKNGELRHFIPGYEIAGHKLACKVVELECDGELCSWSLTKR